MAPYKIINKKALILKFITIIDTKMGLFEITQYSDNKMMAITNLVETTYLVRYYQPKDIIHDQG